MRAFEPFGLQQPAVCSTYSSACVVYGVRVLDLLRALLWVCLYTHLCAPPSITMCLPCACQCRCTLHHVFKSEELSPRAVPHCRGTEARGSPPSGPPALLGLRHGEAAWLHLVCCALVAVPCGDVLCKAGLIPCPSFVLKMPGVVLKCLASLDQPNHILRVSTLLLSVGWGVLEQHAQLSCSRV